MESLIASIRSAILDPQQAPLLFRQLHNNKIFKGGYHVTLHQIWRFPDETSVYRETEIYGPAKLEIQKQVRVRSAQGQEAVATLQLLKVHDITPIQFLELIDAYEIDSASLLVLNSGPFHFQCFKGPAVQQDECDEVTFGLAHNIASILWRWDRREGKIRGITIADEGCPFNREQLERFKGDLMHPLALGYLALHVHLEKFIVFNRKLKEEIAALEMETGYRGQNQAAQKSHFAELGDKDLDLTAQTINVLHHRAFDIERTFRAMKGIISEIIELADESTFVGVSPGAPNAGFAVFQTSLQWHLKSLGSLQNQTQHLMNRVGFQETMFANFKAQRDAKWSIKLAKSSKQLAEAAQRDSSSMQTIAVMTMLVLPATFFAALFAMPLLKWDQSPVIQDKFWVYLAFTLPCTFLIFVIWVLTTKLWYIKKWF